MAKFAIYDIRLRRMADKLEAPNYRRAVRAMPRGAHCVCHPMSERLIASYAELRERLAAAPAPVFQ